MMIEDKSRWFRNPENRNEWLHGDPNMELKKPEQDGSVNIDQVLMCCDCGKNLALTIYQGNSLCNDCYQDRREGR